MSYTPLLNLLWRTGCFSGRVFDASEGEKIAIVSEGEQGEIPGVWDAAQIVVDGEHRRGKIAVGADTKIPENSVLRVVEKNTKSVLGSDDKFVPQIEYKIDPEICACYDKLVAGANSAGVPELCAQKITKMDDLHRTALYTALLVERLQRKTERVMAIFGECGMDWHQTFHTLLLQSMGGDKNKEAFTRLAQKATATILSREKGTSQRVEALLLGAAGFLLDDEFRHMANKYQIVPLKPSEWNFARLYPANHPDVRLREMAALLTKREFMLDSALDCLDANDVERLFTDSEGRSIGRSKAHLVGINLVAPLMFAYGKQTRNEHLCERALDLLATIPAERNSKLAGWYSCGVEVENAFDSQALLELATEYCAHKKCARCRIGREEIMAEIKKMSTFTR